ncbi:hypothetical protein J7T55_002880 [Diaporthe amygdali]|uniref:uncharacterized protein n=1 Tax=Phomopsis amygdali TaxID=1214568 RepID=UPI0022FF297D|nr:uncharacterized protein J7T55_002880 [Diaporthe amygdali]KAJ0122367.1 hypothetical protein J7T55_002880 [Diaporthe amygdali]
MPSIESSKSWLYRELPSNKRTIRLLRLLPGRPEDHEIRCQLYESSLIDAVGNYKALSYTWGSGAPECDEVVCCDGLIVPVTLNLYSALHKLRDLTATLTLWVDSLCIDQYNENERTHQVGMMREIYANSKEVIIWLGAGRSDVTATDSVEVRFSGDERDVPKIEYHLGRLWRGQLELPPGGRDVFGAFCVISMLAQGLLASRIWYLKNLDYAPPIIRGLLALLDEPWWTRIWVVQETVVSARAIVHYNNISMPWEAFSRASLCYLTGKVTEQLGSAPSETYGPSLTRFHRLVNEIDTTKRDWNAFEPSALLPLLRKFRAKDASDKRDKVYALIGLVNFWGQDEPLIPDYGLRLSKVYWQTTKRLIRSSKTLAVLSGTTAAGKQIQAGFPTWVTDWSYRPSSDEADRLNSQHLYNAADQAMEGIKIHGQTLLEAKGYSLDRVSLVLSWNAIFGEDLRTQAAYWKFRLPWPENTAYLHGGTLRTAFWRTICGNVIYVPEARTERERFRKAVASDVKAFESWCKVDKSTNRRTSIIGGTWQGTVSSEEQITNKKRNAYKLAVECASRGRCFFVTEQGRLGIGPPSLKADDEVYILHGSRVPMILRRARTSRTCRDKVVEKLVLSTDEEHATIKAGGRNKADAATSREATRFSICNESHEDCYKVVGDAYVHGLMEGGMVWEDRARTRLKKTKSVYIV